MKNESVAVLDIRSFEVTFLIGAKGVNGTFVFRGSKSEKYEGYTTDGFLDAESFRRAISRAVSSVLQNYDGKINGVYVGVPSAFTSVYTKGHTISFPSKRKITSQETDALYEAGLSELMASGRYIRRSEMYFSLGDNRKYFSAESLYGAHTSSLKGALCYYFTTEAFFGEVNPLLERLGFSSISYLPQTLAQAIYLLPEKAREGYAFLLDIGFLSSSVSVIYGNGVVHEESFDFGTGQILLSLMEEFSVEYEKAEEILSSANISGGAVSRELMWTDAEGNSYPVARINDVIKFGLDGICEKVDAFFAKYYRDKSVPGFAQSPLSLTGEGACAITGAAEHISKRLARMTEIVNPDVPYYDKPMYSSRIALLDGALSEQKRKGLRNKILNIFGGKRK